MIQEPDFPKIFAAITAASEPHPGGGAVANYIPALAAVAPMKFDICVLLALIGR